MPSENTRNEVTCQRVMLHVGPKTLVLFHRRRAGLALFKTIPIAY
jgi:hypothetical protein